MGGSTFKVMAAILLSVIISLFSVDNGQAAPADHYVVAGGTGSRNGSNWANAWSALPSSLTRGDTYYIGDGNYSGREFEDNESGSAVITIKKATGADHGTDTGWSSTYGDGYAQFGALTFKDGYYHFDGQVGGGPGNWDTGHGFRIRDNGRDLFRLGQSTYGMYQPGHITLEHVDAGGTSVSSTCYHTFYQWAGSKAHGSRNITIRYCYMHDSERSILFGMYGRDWLFEYNFITRNASSATSHGSGFADRGTDNMIIRYNRWADIEGTAYIDVKKNEDQTHDNWQIYGNIFYKSNGNPYNIGSIGGNGVIGMTSTNSGWSNNMVVYNNTFVNITGLNSGVYFPLLTLRQRGEKDVSDPYRYR